MPNLLLPTNAHYDAELWLELSEHALLLANGWRWEVRDFHESLADTVPEAVMVWVAPPNHKGSNLYYQSRAHAINSHKRWNMGLGSLANKNPKQRLVPR